MRARVVTGAWMLLAVGLGTFANMPTATAKSNGRYQIYLSMSYVGNGWQNEATNMIKGMAAYYGDKLDLHVQAAGPVAQRQIQQINSMVQAGADAIIVYPISPTALNTTIRHACSAGVVVFAYDSRVTEPCAYNVHPDQYELAASAAEWVAKQLNHKGNLLFVTGVPGTTVDTDRTRGYRDVVKKYPDMKIAGEVNGMWSLAITEKVITEFMATHKWSDIDGVIGSGGGWTAWQSEKAAGLTKLTPYGTDGANATRVAMLPVGSLARRDLPVCPDGRAGDFAGKHADVGRPCAEARAEGSRWRQERPQGHRDPLADRHDGQHQAVQDRVLGGDAGRLQRVRSEGDQLGLRRQHLFADDA